ncbi:MAG: hypothetical protein ACPGJS_10125 [Flammeovirgaceae bacterium]
MKHFVLTTLLCFSLLTLGKAQDSTSIQPKTVSELQDSLGIWNFFMVDLNVFTNNRALLFSFEHPIANSLRLSHSIGPILNVETHENFDSNGTLRNLNTNIWGFKFQEEIKYLFTQNNYGRNWYIGLAGLTEYYRVNDLEIVERVFLAGNQFFELKTGGLSYQKISFLVTIGKMHTHMAPFVFDTSIGVGFRHINYRSHDGRFSQETLDDLYRFDLNGAGVNGSFTFRIGFMPKKNGRKYVSKPFNPIVERYVRRINRLNSRSRKLIKERIRD